MLPYLYDIAQRVMVSKASRVKSAAASILYPGPNLDNSNHICQLSSHTADTDRTHRSHFNASCDAISYMSSNMPLMDTALKAGIRIR